MTTQYKRFWVDPEAEDDLAEGEMPVFMALPSEPTQGPPQWRASLIPVIEVKAVDDLQKKLDKAVEALKYIGESDDAFAEAERDHAREALKEIECK